MPNDKFNSNLFGGKKQLIKFNEEFIDEYINDRYVTDYS